MNKPTGAWAALVQSAATLVALGIGLLLMMQTGASDGSLAGASTDRVATAQTLLIAAELTKLVSAASFTVMSLTLWQDFQSKPARVGAAIGLLTALLLFASACPGLTGILLEDRTFASVAMALGLASLAVSGAFSLACMVLFKRALSPVVRSIGLAFSAAAIASPIVSPVALLAALLGIIWWGSLSVAFRKRRGHGRGRS